jgi:tRNA threonylcarbamoyladenosine biosynthesis protein TsaE
MKGTGLLAWQGVDETALTDLARHLAGALRSGGPSRPSVASGALGLLPGGVIYLVGELGAGKTTFARALLGALGVGSRVKSPTYSLIESYSVAGLAIHHLDLYRIAEPGELEWLGLADLTAEPHLLLVEWPEHAGSALPEPDLIVKLVHSGMVRDVAFETASVRGDTWLSHWGSASDESAR